MQDIRYHIINTSSVIIFSFLTALTISQIIRLNINPVFSVSKENTRMSTRETEKNTYDDYKAILDSTFFKIASESDKNTNVDSGVEMNTSNVSELQLLGTISGPASIAQVLLKKRGEKESKIYKLWNDVYGYKLVRIDNGKIYLKKDKTIETIELYSKFNITQGNSPGQIRTETGGKSTQSISRAEIQQKLMNNIDNALEGLRAGPNKVNGKIDGYKLMRVSPGNILYKLGARSGDIAKRINGHPIDSTEKLLGLWQSIQGESKITVDIERGGKLQTFEFNVTD